MTLGELSYQKMIGRYNRSHPDRLYRSAWEDETPECRDDWEAVALAIQDEVRRRDAALQKKD